MQANCITGDEEAEFESDEPEDELEEPEEDQADELGDDDEDARDVELLGCFIAVVFEFGLTDAETGTEAEAEAEGVELVMLV